MKAGIAILVSDRADFKTTKVIWDKERHSIMTGVNSPRRHNNS